MFKIKPAFILGLVVTGCLHFSSLQAAVLTGVNPTIFNVGNGADLSYLVIDESRLYSTPLEYIYHYTYDSNNLLTTAYMMNSITNVSSLRYTFGSKYGEVQTISYAGKTVSCTDFTLPDGFYWSLYYSGGLDQGAAPANPNQWNYGNSGVNGGRTIAPGSWDGITYSGYGTNPAGGPPSVAVSAVPEPATMPLLLLSLTGLVFLLRWKSYRRI